MNFKDKDITIGQVVAELPEASRIFSEYGIDFCCGGHRNLQLVINEQDLEEEKIYEELELAQKERTDSYKNSSFVAMKPFQLTTYIQDKHHSYLREALPQIAELLGTILRVHGKNHSELFEIYRLYGALKTDLEQHLLKEETMLFPALAEDSSNEEDVIKYATEIIKEHEAAGEVLVGLRKATNDYKLPEDACGTYQLAYMMLENLEKDLHEHIHLENNILLKDYDYRVK